MTVPSLTAITVEADDPETALAFYRAIGLVHVRVRGSGAATAGFRGFALSLVAAQPSAVDALLAAATEHGAEPVQPAKRSLWGYGGSVRTPDGTLLTLASASKRETGAASGPFDSVVLQLGVDDVAASRAFYEERGFGIDRSFGKRYAELATGGITVSLNARRAVAKAAGVDPEGSGSHRLAIHSDAGAFVDPDGFAWEAS